MSLIIKRLCVTRLVSAHPIGNDPETGLWLIENRILIRLPNIARICYRA